MLAHTVDAFIFFLVGIPGAAVSLTFLILGIARRSVKLSIFGAVISLGFCYVGGGYTVMFGIRYFDIGYNAGYLWLTFFILAGGNVLSVLAVWKRIYSLAAISITPFVAVTVFMVGLAIPQVY